MPVAREREDYTKDRSDPKGATLIAHLARDLRCYLAVAPEAAWARRRHLGLRRHDQLAARTGGPDAQGPPRSLRVGW